MISKKDFADRVTKKYGDKYNLSLVPDIIQSIEKTKITIICPEHGPWTTTGKNLLDSKYGCPTCAKLITLEARKNKSKNKLSEVVPRPDIIPINEPLIVSSSQIIGTIYCFINTVNNKIYIGKVLRHDYNERFNEHRSQSVSDCIYFYRAIDKYGWNTFQKYILFQTEVLPCTLENKKKLNNILLDKEKYYIKLYKSNDHTYGYNLTEGGDGIVGYKFSEEAKEKMSKKHSGSNHWNYGKINSAGKRVLQYDLNGKLIKIWDSMADVQRAGIAKSCCVSQCCSGKSDSTGGYVWIKENDNSINLLEKLDKAKRKSNDKSVLQFDLDGNQIGEYISTASAARKYQCDTSTISGAAHGKFDWGVGYIWIYKNEYSDSLLQQKLKIIKEKHMNKKSLAKITTCGYHARRKKSFHA